MHLGMSAALRPCASLRPAWIGRVGRLLQSPTSTRSTLESIRPVWTATSPPRVLNMHESISSATDDAGRLRLAHAFAGLTVLTLCLIIVGALVRANDAGLACPDWPLCHGEVVPRMDLKIAFEWGHRVFAGAISIGLVVLSIVALRDPRLRRPMRIRLIAAWSVLVTQIVFGGLTVLLLLAPWTVGVHLILGNLFCVILLWTTLDLYGGLGRVDSLALDEQPGLPAIAAPLAAIVGVTLAGQLVLGGWVSSHYAGLACTEFPTCDGTSVVPTWQGLVGIHVMHRLNGFLLLAAYAALAFVARRAPGTGRVAALGLALVTLQIGVGVANVLFRIPIALTGLHTGLAAAIVLTTAVLVRRVVLSRSLEATPAAPGRVAEAR